jgi:hypothetical protein
MPLAPRARILAFSGAGLLVLAGALCAALVGGLAGEILTIVLISIGLGGALLLVFLEIGLGEERDRAHEEQLRRERQERGSRTSRPRWGPRWPRRPG